MFLRILLIGICLASIVNIGQAQAIWGPQLVADLPEGSDISDYNTKVSINPDNPKFYKQRADFLMKLQNYDRALQDYKKSLDLDSSLNNIYNNYGVALFKKDKYPKAIQMFNKGIDRNPETGYLYYNRGLTYFRVDQPEKACADLKKGRKLDNNNAKNAYKQYCR